MAIEILCFPSGVCLFVLVQPLLLKLEALCASDLVTELFQIKLFTFFTFCKYSIFCLFLLNISANCDAPFVV